MGWRICGDVAILNARRRNNFGGDPLRRYCFKLESWARRHRAIRRPEHECDRIPRRWKVNFARDVQHASCPWTGRRLKAGLPSGALPDWAVGRWDRDNSQRLGSNRNAPHQRQNRQTCKRARDNRQRAAKT